MTDHTPLPWTVSIKFNGAEIYNGNICIADIYGKNRKANAEFITRACNSHYELLEALKDVCAMFDEGVPEYEWENIKQQARATSLKQKENLSDDIS